MYMFQVIDDFVERVKDTNITIISQEIFQHDPYTRLQNLKVMLTIKSTIKKDTPCFTMLENGLRTCLTLKAPRKNASEHAVC